MNITSLKQIQSSNRLGRPDITVSSAIWSKACKGNSSLGVAAFKEFNCSDKMYSPNKSVSSLICNKIKILN